MSSTVWGEITYPFINYNGFTVDVYERVSNFTPQFVTNVIAKKLSESYWSYLS